MITEKTNVWRSGLSSLAKGLARVLPGSGLKKQTRNSGAYLAVFSAFATLSLLFTPNTTLAQEDPPPPANLTVAFGDSNYTAIENGADAQVMISLNQPADRSVSIPINTSPATGPYTIAFSHVVFDVGEQHRTIAVSANDDKDLTNQTVTLSLGTRPSGVSLGSPSSARVTLWDDDLKDLNISFGSASSTATENGGNATVAITLDSASDRALRIPITATAGTDTVADDYKLSANEVVFNVGQSRKTITISAEDDDDLTAGSVVLGFGTLPAGVDVSTEEGAQTTHTVTLSDDGMRVVEFDEDKYNAPEGGGAQTITVNLEPAPTSNVNIRISFPAPPQNNPKYSVTGLTNNMLTINSDSTSGTFEVTGLEDDDMVSQTVTFRITSPYPATVRAGKTTSTVVTLVDNELPPAPMVSFESGNQAPVNEGSTRTVGVNLNPASDEEVKVDVSFQHHRGQCGWRWRRCRL